jgi:hypothetical protein
MTLDPRWFVGVGYPVISQGRLERVQSLTYRTIRTTTIPVPLLARHPLRRHAAVRAPDDRSSTVHGVLSEVCHVI